MFRFSRDSSGVTSPRDAVYPLPAPTAHRASAVGRAACWAVALALTVAGCDRVLGRSPPPPSGRPATTAPGPRMPAIGPLNLTQRSVDSALRDVAEATHTAVVIDPDASAVASCARIALYAPAGTEPAALLTLVGSALEPHGLRLDRKPSGLVLRRVPGAPLPASCLGLPRSADMPVATPTDEASLEIAAGIRQVSDTEVLVTRAAVDRLFADSSLLMRQARIVPHLQDGRPDGLRLFGIRASSVARALGFQNGDTLHTVDGRDVSSPDHALEAYTAARRADRLVVELDRRGAPLRVTYRVVSRLPSR